MTRIGRDLITLAMWRVPRKLRGRWYVALSRRLMNRWHGQESTNTGSNPAGGAA